MRLGFMIVAALGVACVSTAKYDTLQKQLDDTKLTLAQQLGEKDGRITELEARIASSDRQIAIARADLGQSQDEIRNLEADRARLEAQLTDTVRDRAALQASADSLRSALADSDRRKAETEKRVAELHRLLAQFKSLIDAGKLQVKIVDGRMVLALATDVLFDSGSAQLSPTGKQTISDVTTILVAIPDRKLQVEGHTDNVPIHNARFPSNWELGAERAITIVDTMIAAGMSPTRLSAASFGEFRPVASNDTDDGRGANRRIEIVLVPDLAMLPGFDELREVLGGR